jgi:carbamoyl-phosphate synthase large subunit
MALADLAVIVPRVDEPGYIDALIALCARECIDLLVPVLETELPLLAARRHEFRAVGTTVLVSSSEVVATCHDKVASAIVLEGLGIRSPRTFLSLAATIDALRAGDLTFPVIAKPRFGVGSIGIQRADDVADLEMADRWCRKQTASRLLKPPRDTDPAGLVLFQEYLVGQEYGIDIVNDLAGNYVTTLVRRKLRIRAGQTDRAVTVADPRLELLGERIGRGLGHRGILDCDLFVDGDDLCVIDLNPRFGGGYPFSHAAGANLPAAFVAWIAADPVDPAWLRSRPDVTVARYDDFVVAGSVSPDGEG